MTARDAGRIVDVIQAAYSREWPKDTIAVWIERLMAWGEPFDVVLAGARRMVDSERFPSIAALRAALDLEMAYHPRWKPEPRLALEDRRETLVKVGPLLRETIRALEEKAAAYRRQRIGSCEAA